MEFNSVFKGLKKQPAIASVLFYLLQQEHQAVSSCTFSIVIWKDTSICDVVLVHIPCILYYFALWPTNAQLFHKLSHFYMFRKMGHAVAQLAEALRYKSEGRGFDSRWCHWNFSLTWFFQPHYGPGVDSSSNRNEYQEYFLGVKAAGACRLLWNLGASTSWNPQDLPRPVMGLFYLIIAWEQVISTLFVATQP